MADNQKPSIFETLLVHPRMNFKRAFILIGGKLVYDTILNDLVQYLRSHLLCSMRIENTDIIETAHLLFHENNLLPFKDRRMVKTYKQKSNEIAPVTVGRINGKVFYAKRHGSAFTIYGRSTAALEGLYDTILNKYYLAARGAELKWPHSNFRENGWTYHDLPDHTLDDLYIHTTVREQLNTLVALINRKWEENPDFSYSIMLKGVPGGGKTSIAEILAKELNGAFTEVVDNISLWSFTQMIDMLVPRMVVLFDELEKSPFIQDKKDKDDKSVGLSTFKKFLTGKDAPKGVLTITCTNDFASLPDTVRRPGRTDASYEIIPVDDAGIRRQLLKLYGAEFLKAYPKPFPDRLMSECFLIEETAFSPEEHIERLYTQKFEY